MNLPQLVAPRTRPPPSLIRKSPTYKFDSCSSPPFPRAGRTAVVALQFETPHSRKFGKRHPQRVLTLDREFAMRNRETHYDGRVTLDAPPRLFKQTFPTTGPNPKVDSSLAKSDTEPTSAVVLRSVLQNCRGVPFKDAKASEAVPSQTIANTEGLTVLLIFLCVL